MKLPHDMFLWDFIKAKFSSKPQPVYSVPKSSIIETKQGTHYRVLDLHGLTVQDAFLASRTFINECFNDSKTELTIITGKSGQIRREFPFWILKNPYVRLSTEMNGGGAFLIKLLRKPQ